MSLEIIKVRNKFQVTLPQVLQSQVNPGDYLACEPLGDGSIRLMPVILQLKAGAILAPTPHDARLQQHIEEAEHDLTQGHGEVFGSVEEMTTALSVGRRPKPLRGGGKRAAKSRV